MDECDARSADEVGQRIVTGAHDRLAFRAALRAVPPYARDEWFDRVLGLRALPDDGPDLPRGCVPYLPCRVDSVLEAVDRATIGPTDVFVDVGSGIGRAMALVHLLTGAEAIGFEIQAGLVQAARDVTCRVSPKITTVHGDAVELAVSSMSKRGTVFFLYCPFSGERLQQLLRNLETLAQTRPIRVCCVDLPLPRCGWLAGEPGASESVAVYRSATG